VIAVLWCSGCGAKGYIVASVQSVIGLDVSENPKTQVPHIRFGYVRSQYYYIPTGKAESGKGVPGGSGKADETPDLVSEMYVNLKFLSSAMIHERFAVGKHAVQTPAAQALFAGSMILSSDPKVIDLQGKLGDLLRQPGMEAKAKTCLKQNFPAETPYLDDPVKFIRRQHDTAPLQKLKSCLEQP
jgi:hypothetical protein